MKSYTYVIKSAGQSDACHDRINNWIAAYAPGSKVTRLADGSLCVEWDAYKAGHLAFRDRVSALNSGLEFARL